MQLIGFTFRKRFRFVYKFMPDYKSTNEGLHIWYLFLYMRGATQPDQYNDNYIFYNKDTKYKVSKIQ